MRDEATAGVRAAELRDAVALLADFLSTEPLTAAIAGLEHDLEGAIAGDVRDTAATRCISPELLVAGLTVRESLGRLNDLIHAAGIVLALPHLLEDGEKIAVRPSLAAGAADRSGRRAELFVVGPEPGRFLRTSRATAAWGLDRTPHARRAFEQFFGSLDISIAEFTTQHAGHVRITDLCDVLPPTVAAALVR